MNKEQRKHNRGLKAQPMSLATFVTSLCTITDRELSIRRLLHMRSLDRQDVVSRVKSKETELLDIIVDTDDYLSGAWMPKRRALFRVELPLPIGEQRSLSDGASKIDPSPQSQSGTGRRAYGQQKESSTE
jgi:hypothetical protein